MHSTSADVIKRRLVAQQLSGTSLNTATEMVRWFGAVQAQEYAQAKWGIGLRLSHLSDETIESEISEGAILRTHLLRPTWHFVTAEDISWLLKLTAPRVEAINAFMYRKLELDTAVFNKCNRVISKILNGGKHLTRDEINTALIKNKIEANGLRLSYIMMHAELEGIVCSGKRHGNQFTYALLEEIIGKSKAFNKEEALAELAKRYFQSRGPATVKDFATWSGLTIKECLKAIDIQRSNLQKLVFENNDHYFLPAQIPAKKAMHGIQLLPIYDEYIMGYKDRSAMLEFKNTSAPAHPFYFDCVIIDKGRIIGTWKRTIGKKQVELYYHPFKQFTQKQEKAFNNSIKRFGKFNKLQVAVVPK
jgi:hypothetical protein